MKKLFYILLFSFILFSCKKESKLPVPSDYIPAVYLVKVKSYLQKNLSSGDYASLDYTNIRLCRQPGNWYLKFGFLGKNPEEHFLLLKTDSIGNCTEGMIMNLKREEGSNNSSVFNGSISIETLHHGPLLSSLVTNGWIEALHPVMFSKATVNSELGSTVETDIIPSPYQELPEVVVVGYISSGGGISYSDWMSFASMLNGGGGSSGATNGPGSGGSGYYSGIYSPIAGGSGGGSGSGSPQPNNIVVYNETSPSKPAINVQAYMKCFGEIPDAGSQCSVILFTDLPVNDDPNVFFNWYTGNTGHAFLQLTKTNGGQSVSQVIGFTAVKPLAALVSNGAVAGKMVDNGGHKYNASLIMHVNPQQFNAEIQELEYLSGARSYSIENYNCVDFALELVNTIRTTNPINIPKYPIPGQPGIGNTPEGLYKVLSSLKAMGGPEAGNILTGVVLSAGETHGPCN